MNKQTDSGNLIAAMVLCVLVIVGWDYFFLSPQREAAKRAQIEQQTAAPSATGAPAVPGAPAGPATAAGPQPREAVIAATGARLRFDNGKVDGSIRLTGGQIDDLRLQNYRETIDPKSPEIVFLSPQGSVGATFAEIGWTAAPGSATAVPGSSTVWTASATTLTATSPATLTWDNGQGLVFTRTIALDENYMFTITDKVENKSGAPVTLYPYALVAREGEPKHEANWILHEGLVAVLGGELKEADYAELRDAEAPEMKFESKGGWLGITDKYWMATIAPPQNEQFNARFSITKGPVETFRTDYILGARNIAAGGTTTVSHNFYAGAKLVPLIETYEEKLGIARFGMSIDWGWFAFFTWPMYYALHWLNMIVGNYGIAIILFTIAIKILFFPLANRSYESMTKMKKVQPQIKELQELYKDDRLKLQQEQIALFQREKINPMMGCLPILIQIPVFFALYKVLFVTIDMRHAPFFGWIQDLAAADPTSLFNLFGLLPYAVPSWLQIGVWPVIMGLTMWFQTKMNPPATDPVQQQMMVIMPPMFTYLMALFPSGLVIYWTVNNVLSILQQWLIMRRLNVPIEIGGNMKLPAWVRKLLNQPDKRSAPGE